MTLFCSRRFLPLFVTQFMGAFNDNVLKNAIVMLITYRLAQQTGDNAQLLVTLAAGLFILPFFLFSATAGQLADKYDRARLTRIIKLVEIGLMLLAGLGFLFQHVSFLLVVLFGMGMHSTFFGPIKYALLPQHLADNELVSGNGYIEAGTFLSILLGTMLGGLLILQPGGTLWVSVALVVFAVIGYAASRFIPTAPAPQPELIVQANLWRETGRIIAYSRENRSVFLCILGISWFWLVGATFLAEFAPFTHDVLNAEPAVVTLLLMVFSVGIGVGSVLCNKLLAGRIKTTHVKWAALGITVFGIDLYLASRGFVSDASGGILSLEAFAGRLQGARILGDLFLMAICAGLYIVPLYAVMQHRSDPRYQARIIAANNVMNAIFMVSSALATMGMLALGWGIPLIFLAISLANGVIGVGIGFRLRS